MHRLDHVALRVADLDRAIAFYTDRIGLSLMFRELDREHGEAFAFLAMEGGNLELLQLLDEQGNPAPYRPTPAAPPYCPHVAIGVDDLDAMIIRLGQAGLSLLKGPLAIPGKVKWAYLADPDENVIEFVEWVEA